MMLYEVFVLMSITCQEGVACGQYLRTIQCFIHEVFVLFSITCREGVACS